MHISKEKAGKAAAPIAVTALVAAMAVAAPVASATQAKDSGSADDVWGTCLKNGHDYERCVVFIDKEATCTERGEVEMKSVCKRCGETYWSLEKVPAAGHRYKEVTVKATCTKAGYTAQKCTRCGKLKGKRAVAKLGHRYSTTWGKNGTYHYKKCARPGCKATKSKARHKYKHVKQTEICKTCGWERYSEYAFIG